jgi:hypothetical protein
MLPLQCIRVMLPSGEVSLDAQGHGLRGSPPRSLPYRPYRDREHLARRDSESKRACQWPPGPRPGPPAAAARPSAYPSSSELRELASRRGTVSCPGRGRRRAVLSPSPQSPSSSKRRIDGGTRLVINTRQYRPRPRKIRALARYGLPRRRGLLVAKHAHSLKAGLHAIWLTDVARASITAAVSRGPPPIWKDAALASHC